MEDINVSLQSLEEKCPGHVLSNISEYYHLMPLNMNIANVNSSLVNSLRRVMISEIPNVGFNVDSNNNPKENSVYIYKNTSALHNEFCTQRIAMIPICVYNSGDFNITSNWNDDICKREVVFSVRNNNKFYIDVKNELESGELPEAHTHSTRPSDIEKDLLCVSSKDLIYKKTTVYVEDGEEKIRLDVGDTSCFIVPDYIIDSLVGKDDNYKGYILLNKLKSGKNRNGESLKAVCVPQIGTGLDNALWSPCGTVAYKFVQDSPETIGLVFSEYIKSLQLERTDKNLAKYDDNEVQSIRESFNTLDAKRVYKRNLNGDASCINLNIETTGGMCPVQIFNYSLKVLKTKLIDIVSCCTVDVNEDGEIYYNLDGNKLELSRSISKMDALSIKILDEDHTCGNVISNYLQNLYFNDNSKYSNVIDFVSYKKSHPLENHIITTIKCKDHVNDVYIKEFFEKVDTTHLNKQFREIMAKVSNEYKFKSPVQFMTVFLFIQGIMNIIIDIDTIHSIWSKLSLTDGKKNISISSLLDGSNPKIKNSTFLTFLKNKNEDNNLFQTQHIDSINKLL